MIVEDTSLSEVVPKFLSDDTTVKGLCAAADYLLSVLVDKLPLVNLYDNLNQLTHKDLDYIAKMDDVLWYDTSYSKEKKINVIMNFEKNCMLLGTKAAVYNVTQEIFGVNEITEWYEYSGQEKHFKVKTEFTGDIETAMAEYIKKIKKAKSFRSIIDELLFMQELSQRQCNGTVLRVSEHIILKEGT